MQRADPIRVFIGFDAREEVAFHVLQRSLHERASAPVSVTPIRTSQLAGVYARNRDPLQSTDFSFSRFLTPWLCGYQGWAVYLDCDMIALGDIAELWSLRNDRFAVQVVKHDYEPKGDTKFLGSVQTRYPMKNWSSVMLFNCPACTALTPALVNGATGLELHQFKWLDPDRIGELPAHWNHLVGEYEPSSSARLAHFTRGGPYFDEYAGIEYAPEWFAERQAMLTVQQTKGQPAR
jgi:hypothetical protein